MTRSFSPATLLGTLFGFALVLGAIAHGTDNYRSFLSMEGFLIVIGGTVANAFMSYHSRTVNQAFEAMWHMIKKPKATREGLHAEIERLIRWAYVVHAKGLPGLEGQGGNKITEPLLRYGVDLVITGYAPEKIREMMHTAVESEFERAIAPVAVLKNMAATAPAFGMVGTLVGMVIMLQNIEADMKGIGAGLAIALLATLYGILFARLLCLPAADKLMQKEEVMRFRNYMVTEGLVLLAEKQTPRYMQDKLNSYLNPAAQFSLDDYRQGIRAKGRAA